MFSNFNIFNLISILICKRLFCVLLWEQEDCGSNYSCSRDWCYPNNNDKFNEFISQVHYFGPKFKSTKKVLPSALN